MTHPSLSNRPIEAILPDLKRLGRLFCWKRKKRLERVMRGIRGMETEISRITGDVARLNTELAEAIKVRAELTRRVDALYKRQASYRRDNERLALSIKTMQEEKRTLQNTIATLKEKLAQQEDHARSISARLEEAIIAKGTLEKELSQEKKKGYKLREEVDDFKQRYDLISSILSAKSTLPESFGEVRRAFDKFIKFANNESSLANEAEAVIEMQEIVRRAEMLAIFPEIHLKTTGAIAGGFSSGKSSFLNGFFTSDRVELPVGINPVTAIPCNIVSSPDSYVIGYTRDGGQVDISLDTLQRFSPEYLHSFPFSLREIMPQLVIGANLRDDLFRHINRLKIVFTLPHTT